MMDGRLYFCCLILKLFDFLKDTTLCLPHVWKYSFAGFVEVGINQPKSHARAVDLMRREVVENVGHEIG